jgi:uncharacterized protein YacL
MHNEKLIDFWKPMSFHLLMCIPLGFGITLINVTAANIFLEVVLRNTVLGLTLFGLYYVPLGIAGIAGIYIHDLEKLEKWIDTLSAPKWMSRISGVLFGITLAALCKKTGINASQLLLCALIFLGITWMVRAYELEVKGKREGENLRLRAWLAPITSLAIGIIAFCIAWYKVCSCGG